MNSYFIPSKEEKQEPIKQFAARLDWLDTRKKYSNKNQKDFSNPTNNNIPRYISRYGHF